MKNSLTLTCCHSDTTSEALLSLITSLLDQYTKQVQVSSNYSRILNDIAGGYLLYRLASCLAYAISLEKSEIKLYAEKIAFDLAKLLPSVRKQLADEKESVKKSLEADLKSKTRAMGKPVLALPSTGQSSESILSIMKKALVTEDKIWEDGKVSGCVYHGDRGHQQLLNTAFSLYSLSVCVVVVQLVVVILLSIMLILLF